MCEKRTNHRRPVSVYSRNGKHFNCLNVLKYSQEYCFSPITTGRNLKRHSGLFSKTNSVRNIQHFLYWNVSFYWKFNTSVYFSSLIIKVGTDNTRGEGRRSSLRHFCFFFLVAVVVFLNLFLKGQYSDFG